MRFISALNALGFIFAALIGGGLPLLSVASPAKQLFNVGVAYVPKPSIPGAKVRTPAPIEILAVHKALGDQGGLSNVPDPALAAQQLTNGRLSVWLGVANQELINNNSNIKLTRLNYSVSPMAIMRTDTTIRSWSDLSGKTVCLTADGRYAGHIHKHFGAIEQIYPSLTDALLNVRIGTCDALVHDEKFLVELLKFPEWQKFSAQLQPYEKVWLSALTASGTPANNKAQQKKVLSAASVRSLNALTADQAREIAFEVYLDQTVPDCH